MLLIKIITCIAFLKFLTTFNIIIPLMMNDKRFITKGKKEKKKNQLEWGQRQNISFFFFAGLIGF